jgi:hypothetical protein
MTKNLELKVLGRLRLDARRTRIRYLKVLYSTRIAKRTTTKKKTFLTTMSFL